MMHLILLAVLPVRLQNKVKVELTLSVALCGSKSLNIFGFETMHNYHKYIDVKPKVIVTGSLEAFEAEQTLDKYIKGSEWYGLVLLSSPVH